MEMKGDKSHNPDHWVKQEQNQGAVFFGSRARNLANLRNTSNKLLQQRQLPENSITSLLCHLVSENDASSLFGTIPVYSSCLTFSYR